MAEIREQLFRIDTERRLEFEMLISEISACFIQLPCEEVDQKIEVNLRRVVDFLKLDRGTLWQSSLEGDQKIVLTHFSARPGIGPSSLPSISSDDYSWISKKVLAGEEVRFSTALLPEDASKDKASIQKFNPVWSGFAFPLSAAGKVFGALGFGVAAEGEWPEEVVQRLRLVAQVFASALIRKRSEERLQQALKQVESLKEQLHRENVYLREEVKMNHDQIIGTSSALRQVLSKVDQVARTDSTVLLVGETGTGKELFAKAIHALSHRKDRIMVRVNCASLPGALIENELFGREKGAYTGALTKQIGRFELADQSSIFLDEIAELPLELQSKLLRVLENGEFERLGSPRTFKVNVRVIAATNRDLEDAVQNGKFREDLYYRLKVFPIEVPPLRERPEDIPILARAFVSELSSKIGKTTSTIDAVTMNEFINYSWPGNVRELRNVIEQGVILSKNGEFNISLPKHLNQDPVSAVTLKAAEYKHILEALRKAGWRIKGRHGAAEMLGLKPSTLYTKMEKLGISLHRMKEP
jgi:transcriptional regulator with GAF, ATPase, and Fis domain